MRRIFVVGAADTKGDLLICKRLSRKQGAPPIVVDFGIGPPVLRRRHCAQRGSPPIILIARIFWAAPIPARRWWQ
jgi:hypothetical protein